MLKGKEKTIPILALAVLIIAISCNFYVHAKQVELEKQLEKYQTDEKIITIFNQDYKVDTLYSELDLKTIQTDEGEKTGISLETLINFIGVTCPGCNQYTFKAIDGYQQTLDWTNMKNGVLTENSRVIFPGLAHSYWVRDVISIEMS